MFINKIKVFLLHLYPELARFPLFVQINTTITPTLKPHIRQLLRWTLPPITILFVLTIGVQLGLWLYRLYTPKRVLPQPLQVITPVPTITYESAFLPLKRSLEEFNPQLPDPLPPVFDEKISLEPTVR